MENKECFRFTTEKAYGILIYYGILFLISLFLSLTGVLNETFFTTFSMTEKALIAGVAATALILSCGLLATRYNRPVAREVIEVSFCSFSHTITGSDSMTGEETMLILRC